jgi:hypothetical protein
MLIDISKLDKAVVLAALFNNSKQQGMGLMVARGRDPLSVAEAAELLKQSSGYFDYLYGRVMKVDLRKDLLDTWGYDRDNGDGAAQRAISQA